MVWLGLARLRGPLTLQRRALWIQRSSRRILSRLGIAYTVYGEPPAAGLVVSNHLSYLDILILGAAVPCSFVAKAEIAHWPFFGMATRNGGTIYIDRSSRASAAQVAATIAERLALPLPILFFPEGTSSDGSSLLRFHSGLFEPAIRARAMVTSASVRYVLQCGTPERELCWFGDAPFLPHLWKALGVSGFTAEVRFGTPHLYPDRRTAAEQTYAEILAMRMGSELVLQ
jgi:1-acyl-sn-glycerol-3-phosphate acyltransferase